MNDGLEASIHRAIKPHVVKRKQGYIMEDVRAALAAHIPRVPDVLPDGVLPNGEGKFDEELFDLCRSDDYAGIWRVLAARVNALTGVAK